MKKNAEFTMQNAEFQFLGTAQGTMKEGDMPAKQRSNNPTVQRSNGQTGKRGGRFAARWTAGAAAMMVLMGSLLGSGVQSAWGETIWSFAADIPDGWTANNVSDAGNYLLADFGTGMQSPATTKVYENVTIDGSFGTYGTGTARGCKVVVITPNPGGSSTTYTSANAPSSKTMIAMTTITIPGPLPVGTVFQVGVNGSTGRTLRMADFTCAGTEVVNEYTWSGTGSGWYLRGNSGGLDWSTGKQMVTDANFGGGNYSRVTLNAVSGTLQYKWFGDSSYWVGAFNNDVASPAKNTAYVEGGGSWGGNFSSSFFTSGKYYTFRGKFYENPSNSSERMNDFVIMETTGAPTEISSAGAGNPSGTAGPGTQTVSVTLNQTPNSEETVYVRYTTDNWANSSTVALTTGSGSSRSGTIPAQAIGTTVKYYFLTTTVPKATLDSNADLCTLNGLKNGANNWSYTVAASAPTVGSPTCPEANVTAGGARLGGTISDNGGATVTESGVQVSTDGGSTWQTIEKTPTATSGAFTVDVTGLTGGLTYTYRAYAVNSAGTGYSGTGTFTTPCPTWGSITPGIDGSGGTSAVFSWNKVPGAAGYLLSVWQGSGGGSSTKTDTLTPALTGNPSSYTEWSGKTDQSTAVYAGQSSGGTDKIQIRKTSPSGIVTTTSGGTVLSVSVKWASGNTSGRILNIYGKNTAYDDATDLYDSNKYGTLLGTITEGTSTNLVITGSYAYIGIIPSTGAAYLTHILVNWSTSGGSRTDYYGTSAGGAAAGTWNSGNNKWEQTVSGLTAGQTYNYKLEATGGGSCPAAALTDTFSTSSANAAPEFSSATASGSATVGHATLGTYSFTPTMSVAGYPAPTYSLTTVPAGLVEDTDYTLNTGTGAFTFTPTVAGSYVFVMRASNSEGNDSCTITVTVTAGTPTITDNGVSGSAGAAGATLTASASAMGAATTVSFGYSETTGGPYTDATAAMMSGASLEAGAANQTVTAALTGLTAGTTYYYKWTAKRNGVAVTSTTEDSFTTGCFASGPSVTAVGGSLGATFTIGTVSGAAQYLLSVWTGGAGTTPFSFDFDANTTGWTLSRAQRDSNALRIGTKDYAGTAVSPSIAGNGGTATLSFTAWTWSGDGDCTLSVEVSGDNGSTWSELSGSPLTISVESKPATPHALTISALTSTSQLRFSTPVAKKRVYIDDIVVTQGGGADYATGTIGGWTGTLQDKAVSGGTTVTVSGLAANTSPGYNWSVKVVGGTCSEETSGTGLEVSEEPAPAVTVSEGGSAIGATVDWGTREITGGAVTKTFTVRNSGDAALASLGNPSLGTGGQGFTVSSMGEGSLSVNGTTTFTVTFTPDAGMSAGATKTDTVSFDWDGNTYTFTVTATVPAATLTASNTSISGFIGTEGYVGTGKSFTLSGSHLTAADVEFTLSDTSTWQVKVGSASYATGGSITPTSGSVPSTTIYVRLKNGATAGNKTGTLTISGGGAASVTVNLSGTVYPMPTPSPASATATVARNATASLDLSDYVTHHASYTYSLTTAPGTLTSGTDYTFTPATGDLSMRTATAGEYEFVITITNTDGKSATFTWTVTVADAPTITKGEASTSGTTATVPATVNAGGAATTVTFAYGTAEGTYNLNPASLSGGSVAAGATSAAASASLTGLTQGTMYYYQWTAVNAGGTTVETGSFFQPGDGLEFPSDWNNWPNPVTGTTVRDAEFGGGNYYYTPAVRLTGDQEFKAYKGGTWYGNGYWVTGNKSQHVFTVNENTANNQLCVTTGGGSGDSAWPASGVGYYTLRGHDTGSGIEYVALYTENAPVTFTAASDNHATQGTGPVTVSATLSGAKSASEKVYVRYTTDGWTTSSLVQMSGSGTSYTGTIPGQGKGTTVEWYVLTSPHDAVADHVDLCTLHGMKSGTTNFSYTTTLLPPTVNSVVAGYEKVSLGWSLNAAGNNVMIVRYSVLVPAITDPVDGTAYTTGETPTIGTGEVIYKSWNGTSLENVVTQGTGYTYVFYSVEGSGSSSKYSEGVVRTTLAKSLATPTVGVTTAGAGTLTGATADSGEIYVVSRIAGSGSFSGNPSGDAPDEGQSLCGGTVVYKGTVGSFTVTDMEGCQTYKYKAWLRAADEAAWSAGSTVATVSMPTPSAPVLSALSDVTFEGFTASWNAVPGAVTYRMDIVKGGGSTTYTLVTGSGTVEDGEYLISDEGDARLMSAYGSSLYTAVTATFTGSAVTSAVTDSEIWVIKNHGTYYTIKNKDSGNYVSYTGSSNTAAQTDDETEASAHWDLTLDSGVLSANNKNSTDRYLQYNYNNGNPRFLGYKNTQDDLHLYKVSGGATPVAGWTDKDVGSLMTVSAGVVSVEVEGLDEQTLYTVTVRAEGATSACTSGDSNSESATTLEDTSLTGVAIANYDASGESAGSNVAAGNVAAGQTVLVQGSKLTVAAGSVNPTLTGMTFTTAGTAGTGDVTTYRVKVTQSATWTAGDTGLKGTVACSGAATSHTVTFGSAQTLTAGQTYYVWIEAVTASGASGGATVGVAALTVDAFTMTGARKTGSTAATGLQTIGNLTAFSAATGATLGGQIGLTWTAGASGTLTVRWSTSDNIPGPGTPWANETTGLTGGTSTLTGLAGCQGYYLKAWEVVGGVACGGVRTATATASAPAAPTGLNHGTPGAHDATLTWTAGAGAAGYSVDVWHFEGGGVSGIEGTYTLITSEDDLADGNYVFVESRTGALAMNNVNTSSRLYPVSVTEMLSGDGNTILTLTDTAENSNIVWKLSYDSTAENWTIQSVGNSQYVSWSSGNAVILEDSVADNYDRWTLVFSGGTVKPTNVGDSSRSLQYNYNSGSDFFACYTSSQSALKLYKQTGGSGTKMDDVVANATASGSTAECTVSGTGATLTHLTDGTTYYWTVKSLGEGGCAGGTSSQDSFTTAELLGVPTIGTPLTVGVGQLSGTVTGKAGATLILKRYDTEDLAGTGTAWGLDGTVVSAGETTPGSGVWTFTDTGLDGCTTYWYKAWQWEVIDGDTATSGGSAVASAQTALAAPTVSAVGAGTQLTVNWLAVPGAASYKVQISDTAGVWEETAGGEGAAVLDEAFAGFTASTETDISGSLNTYTEETGWTGSKVYCNEGSAKLGSSKAAGELVTPSISAMVHGGKVYFDLKKYSTDTGSLKVEQSTDGGSTWGTLDTFPPSDDWQTGLEATIPAGASAFKIRFATASKNRAYIDNVRVVPLDEVEEGTGRGLIYESTVTSAPWSRTKTGLEIGATYYYRVIVTGAEGCTTEAGGSAMTANAPIIEVMPTHYNFGTVTKNSGEHTAEFVVRNAGNVPLKFSAVSLVQDGDAYSFVSPAASARIADLAAGASRTYTVQFNPQNSGTRLATLRFGNDAYNATGVVPVPGSETYANTDIDLSGTCFDPATADPDVLWLSVTDGLGVENTVWDDSMAHSASQPVLAVIAYHYNGMAWDVSHPDWAKWSLYDEEGNAVLENQAFSAMTTVAYDGRSCSRFTAPIPALGAANTYRGKYTVGVTLKDATRTYTTTTREIVPVEQEWLLDDFMRADAVGSGGGALGNSWVAQASSGSLPGSAAIRGAALELYGPGGLRSGTAGRVAAGRDMSDERYPTTWKEFTGSGSWGFHFKTGAKTVSWADGSTAGAFVLGATHVAWFTSEASQKGVAVMFTNDCVRLVRFEKSLLASGTITDLTTAAYNGTQGKWLAVRVDYIPGQPEVDADESDDGQHHAAVPAKMRLFVKAVAGPDGNPVEECGNADLVEMVDVGDTVSGDLKYGGAVWNHGTAQLSETTGGTFDDIYVPHMDGQGEPMEFHVIDEDTVGPEFYGFSIRGAVAAPDVASSGLTVTGMVHDASGLSGTVGYKMYNGETLLTSGTMAHAAASGSTTEYTLTCTIPAGVIDGSIRSSNCRFEVTATDGDNDRSEGGTNVDAMEGTGSFPFTFCASTPTAPGWATAEIDGAEMVVLRWAHSGGTYVVVRSDVEIGEQSSPQGRTGEGAMDEGTTVEGWGKVVYNGTGDNHLSVENGWTAREFIVDPGSTNYFAVYGMTGDESTGFYFSAPTIPNAYAWATTNSEGVVTHHTATSSGTPVASEVTEGAWPCVTPKYEPGEGVDAFAYRTSVTDPNDTTPQTWALPFNCEYDSPRPQTGSGWGGPWTGDVGTWKVHDGALMTSGTHFPTPAGNKLFWEDTSSSSPAQATLCRPLASPNTSGKFFVAGMLNYGGGLDESMFDTAGTWVTIALVDENDDVLVSFGKQGGGTLKDATLQVPVGQFGVTRDPVECRNTGGDGGYYTLYSGHTKDYIVAGEVDRENKMLRMWVFFSGEGSTVEIPQVYPLDTENKYDKPTALESVQASWSWEGTAPNWAGKIAGIKLIAGSDGSHQLGHVYFDEIRFATSWQELFLFNDPEVYTYDFDKPETGTGEMVGLDEEGHRMWRISDGALAHGDVGLNAQFGLYHRTGVSSANFTIKDADGNPILKSVEEEDDPRTEWDERLAREEDETGHVRLSSGSSGHAYSDWKTPSGGAMGTAIPTNRISLEETYTVEVTLTSAGGREATVTSASETGGGGMTDELFIGEYGENAGYNNYLELYNATGASVDLRYYWIAVLSFGKDDQNQPIVPTKESIMEKYEAGSWAGNGSTARLGAGNVKKLDGDSVANMTDGTSEQWPEGPFMLPDRSTVCLVPSNCDDEFIKALLTADPPVRVVQIHQAGMQVSGNDPQMLLHAEGVTVASQLAGTPWLDMAGLVYPGRGTVEAENGSQDEGQYIMYRLDDATIEVPRRYPDVVNWDEWYYRDWRWWDDDDGWTNLLATAGVYDQQKLGLGGNMEFKVYDDDTVAPVLRGGGVSVGGVRREAAPGDRVYVMGAWSFTNWPAGKDTTADLTEADYEQIAGMWPMGMTTSGGISWSPLLGESLGDVLETTKTASSGQSEVEFDGLKQVKRGDLLAKANRDMFSPEVEVWLGFDMDVSKLNDAVLTFGYAGGPSGFQNGRVEVSTTGLEDSFKMPTGWDFTPQSGTNATTWAEWSGDLADAAAAVPEVATAGHLWFRVVLKNYKAGGGTFRMDNIRLEGAPEAVRVSDAELRTQDVAFDARVLDEASGLDEETATFEYGVAGVTLTPSRTLNDGGKSESTFTWSKAGGFEKAKVQEWYTNSLSGKTQLRVSISDKDDDRPSDATTMTSAYGLLDVFDDDAEPPVLEMATMKPRKEGVFAEWKPKEKTQTPSETMEGLDVGALELFTTAGRTSKPRYAGMGEGENTTYALFANGWQLGTKYWTTTISNSLAGAGNITRISFQSKVGNVLAPTGFRVEYGTVAHGAAAAESTAPAGSGSLLTAGDAWSKDNDAEAGGSPIKTWKEYELAFDTPIPLATAGAAGDMIELRIFGTGADSDGIGAYWYLWDLKLEGEITLTGGGGEDGYTYVTDNSLAGGSTLELSGSVYDEVSGLLAAPTYALTNVANGQVVSSGTIAFSEEKDLSARKTKGDGAFSQNIAVSALGYGVQLAEYKGGIHAEDADDDRGTSGEDKLSLDAQFAFTVIDQDLVGPTAPANVTVNGTTVDPESTPNRLTVTWTNKPEFLISFDVANDQIPTVAQLMGMEPENVTWRSDHGITNGMVKKASIQCGAAGVGEYRVSLATGAAAMSNAPAFSVAVTNGALANYGFERYADASWTNPDSSSGINLGKKPDGVDVYPVAEGTNSYYLRAYTSDNNNPVMSQIIPFAASESDQTLTVDLSLQIYKRAAGSIVYAQFAFSADEANWTEPIEIALNSGSGASGDQQNVWLSKTMSTQTLTAEAGKKYLRFSLRSNSSGGVQIDGVRLSVRVGAAPAEGTADRATMRYLADTAAQGLNVKYLFAADADNNRPQDRMLGETATFYTAYDCTPPTPVEMDYKTGASTEDVDDPTTQMKLTWSPANVGPDDPKDGKHPTHTAADKDILSPWKTYKVYYTAYDPTVAEEAFEYAGGATTPTKASVTNYFYETFLKEGAVGDGTQEEGKGRYTEWASVTVDTDIEDSTATTDYDDLGSVSTGGVTVYDLENDLEYVFVTVGVDSAGNEGPATSASWATNNTIKFSITRGWHMKKAVAVSDFAAHVQAQGVDNDIDLETSLTNDVVSALEWTAAGTSRDPDSGRMVGNSTKDYDLLHWDARSFRESPDNDWQKIATVRTSWFVDDGGPTNRGAIRFYRASYKDRWKKAVTNATTSQVTQQTPLVSEEVYAQTAIPLRSGPDGTNTYVNQEEGNQNFVALHGVPYTNTFRAVFGGLETFPGGTKAAEATCIDFYTPGTNAISTESYFLKEDGEWYRDGDETETPCSDVLRDRNFFTRAFSISLPHPIPDEYVAGIVTNWHGKTPVKVPYMLWKPILQVPTNGFSQSIVRGTQTAPVYNIVALRLPVAAHPSQMNLVTPSAGQANNAGLYIGHSRVADQIYTIDPITREPGQACYCRWEVSHVDSVQNDVTNTVAVTNLVWRFVSGDGLVPDGYFKPNDVLVIRSRNGGDADGEEDRTWTWTYHPTNFYSLPHRHMQAGK